MCSASVRSGLRGSLYLLLGVLQYHCVMLWAVSTFITKAFIAGSCHGVVLWVVRHRRVFIGPRVSLTEFLGHVRTLLPFACYHDFLSLSGHRLLRNVVRFSAMRVLLLTLLSCIARGRPHALEFCCTVFLAGEDSECLHFSFLLCTAFLLDEASTKCGYPSLLTWRCTSLSAGLPWWSFLALFHSRASCTSGTDSSAAHPCCVELFTISFSLSQARLLSARDLQHRTWRRLSTALLSARGRVSACSGPCSESSSGSSVPTLALVESPQFSAQPLINS